MNCLDVQEKIIDLLLGEIDPEDEALIQEHLNSCPTCYEDFKFLKECLDACSLPEISEFNESYWDEFAVSIHERITHEKLAKKFPFRIVLPIAASAIIVFGIGYYFFLRPTPQPTAQGNLPHYEYDPYEEVNDLSPEEAEEFIELINQRYGEW